MTTLLDLSCFFYIILATTTSFGDAQLTISASTPESSSDPTTPNTFIGTVGDQIASSLLDSSTPAMMWGVVSSDDINSACSLIVNTGTLTITATVSGWGGTEDLTLQIQGTAGCLAAGDGSGTEFLFTDNYDRQSCVVCPRSNAGSTGCGIYVTGDDINDLYNSYNGEDANKGFHVNTKKSNRKLLDCQGGAEKGAITGAISGVMDTSDCLNLGSEAPFCVAGVLGVSAAVGAANGCINNCFPADAIVPTLPLGTFKRMSHLEIGDKIAVWGEDNRVTYEDVYAFGHKSSNVNATFLRITVEPLINWTNTADLSHGHILHLRLTHMHFVPTASNPHGNHSFNDVIYKRAQDIEIGDIMWAILTTDPTKVAPSIVKEISLKSSQGLYNPFTMSGTLIVDGVVASAHSDWFMDSIFTEMGLTAHLPHAYQMLLAPVRLLYYILGNKAYAFTYECLDASLDIATFGTRYGAHITLPMMFGTLASLIMAFVMTTKIMDKQAT